MTTPPRVYVDVVEPGRALITGPGMSGRVWRQRRRLHVEDTDSEQHVGTALTYADAGRLLADHHGLTAYTVEVEHE